MPLARRWKRLLLACFIPLIILLIWFWSIKPVDDDTWVPERFLLPQAVFDGDTVRIQNIRNYSYRTMDDFTPAYYEKNLDLDKLSNVWFCVERFYKGWRGPAHVWLSFGFESGDYVAISIETRRKRGVNFNAIIGLFKRYQLMYAVADEKDMILPRTILRKNDVFVYPVKTSRETMRKLFVDMLERANNLHNRPEFYNTILNSCSTNLARHANILTPARVPFSLKVIFPGYSDKLAYELGIIESGLSLGEMRRRHRVNDRVPQREIDLNFSNKIRGL